MARLVRRVSDDESDSWQDTPEGREALETDPERRAWAIVGRAALPWAASDFKSASARPRRRAGISERFGGNSKAEGRWSAWLFVPNPRPANLVAAAQAVEIDPESLFEILGKGRARRN